VSYSPLSDTPSITTPTPTTVPTALRIGLPPIAVMQLSGYPDSGSSHDQDVILQSMADANAASGKTSFLRPTLAPVNSRYSLYGDVDKWTADPVGGRTTESEPALRRNSTVAPVGLAKRRWSYAVGPMKDCDISVCQLL
jgi:hypothetical protein